MTIPTNNIDDAIYYERMAKELALKNGKMHYLTTNQILHRIANFCKTGYVTVTRDGTTITLTKR